MQSGFQSTNTTTQLKHQHQHHPPHITQDLPSGGFKDHNIIDQTSSTKPPPTKTTRKKHVGRGSRSPRQGVMSLCKNKTKII
jgi:hypothetical protein